MPINSSNLKNWKSLVAGQPNRALMILVSFRIASVLKNPRMHYYELPFNRDSGLVVNINEPYIKMRFWSISNHDILYNDLVDTTNITPLLLYAETYVQL